MKSTKGKIERQIKTQLKMSSVLGCKPHEMMKKSNTICKMQCAVTRDRNVCAVTRDRNVTEQAFICRSQ